MRPHGSRRNARARSARLGWASFVAWVLTAIAGSVLLRPEVTDERARAVLRAGFPLVLLALGVACLIAYQRAVGELERARRVHAGERPVDPWASAKATLVLAGIPLVGLALVQLGGLRGAGPLALVGIVLALVWFQVAWPRAVVRLLPTQPIADEALRGELTDLAQRAGMSDVAFAAIEEAEERVAMALGARRVLFSTSLLSSLPREQTLAVAAHELAHLARRDALRRALLTVVLFGLVLALHALLADAAAPVRAFTVVAVGALGAPLALRWQERRAEVAADAFATRFAEPRALGAALEWLEARERSRGLVQRALASHPPLAHRLRALRAAEAQH